MIKFELKDIENAIKNSFINYKASGPRSTEKLKPIHIYIKNILENIWGKGFTIYCIGNNGEYKVKGKYYEKNIDIAVIDKKCNNPVFCVGVKFVTSNYKQNANNYFENMMGETANIQALKNLPYAQLLILRYKTPYYKKRASYSDKEETDKIEIINEKDLQKYLNLVFDVKQAHRPYIMAVLLIDINEKTNKVSCLSPFSLYDQKFAELLDKNLSIIRFFEEIQNYKDFYLTNKNGDII
ncbi:MAG TPA: hypothetical protein PLM75_07315 [bacterium]|nr:hypothetical protein [bacterium]HPP87647.1 hypothetical protein [bacterium]